MRHFFKKRGIISIILAYIIQSFSFAELGGFDKDKKIYNKDIDKVVQTDDIKDPLRDGTYSLIQGSEGGEENQVQGVINIGQITSYMEAQSQTLQLVQNIINYALGFLSFIALVYLMYSGFLMVTANGDDGQFKKGQSSLRLAGYAIVGIGLSRIIIRFILRFLDQIVTM